MDSKAIPTNRSQGRPKPYRARDRWSAVNVWHIRAWRTHPAPQILYSSPGLSYSLVTLWKGRHWNARVLEWHENQARGPTGSYGTSRPCPHDQDTPFSTWIHPIISSPSASSLPPSLQLILLTRSKSCEICRRGATRSHKKATWTNSTKGLKE
jgi:hypothetical protein